MAKRLDSRWQSNLKKKDILSYNERKYVWFINDLDRLVNEYKSRTERKKPLNTEWDYEQEKKRGNTWATSAEYKLPAGLASDLSSSLEHIEQRKKEIKQHRLETQKEIQQLRKTSPQSFMEAVEASNLLSAHDIKSHGELQDKALKWLYNKGYIVASE